MIKKDCLMKIEKMLNEMNMTYNYSLYNSFMLRITIPFKITISVQIDYTFMALNGTLSDKKTFKIENDEPDYDNEVYKLIQDFKKLSEEKTFYTEVLMKILFESNMKFGIYSPHQIRCHEYTFEVFAVNDRQLKFVPLTSNIKFGKYLKVIDFYDDIDEFENEVRVTLMEIQLGGYHIDTKRI